MSQFFSFFTPILNLPDIHISFAPSQFRKHSIKISKMHLMYTLDSDGKRVYTLKKIQDGEVTKSAHPARFSPDDKYSR